MKGKPNSAAKFKIRKENEMEYLVQFNYLGRVTYEIEADDEETAKREAANRWLVWVSADAVGYDPEVACAGIEDDTMTAERLIDGDIKEVNENV